MKARSVYPPTVTRSRPELGPGRKPIHCRRDKGHGPRELGISCREDDKPTEVIDFPASQIVDRGRPRSRAAPVARVRRNGHAVNLFSARIGFETCDAFELVADTIEVRPMRVRGVNEL